MDFSYQLGRSGKVVTSAVFLLLIFRMKDLDNNFRFVLSKGGLVNFFVLQIPRTNKDKYFSVRGGQRALKNSPPQFSRAHVDEINVAVVEEQW